MDKGVKNSFSRRRNLGCRKLLKLENERCAFPYFTPIQLKPNPGD